MARFLYQSLKSYCLWVLITVTPYTVEAQSPQSGLERQIRTLDSLLFDVAFNTCDLAPLDDLISEDFEFYHDQGGITASKADFIKSIKENICNINYRPIRRLVDGTFRVFPMTRNGELYGAIQESEHRFFAKEEGKPEYFTSIAKLNHLWIREDGKWKLHRVLSYDHSTTNKP